MADPLGITHQLAENPVLRIETAGVKRRGEVAHAIARRRETATVPVFVRIPPEHFRQTHRIGVRNIVIHPGSEVKIQDRAHERQPGIPAVGSENLADRPSAHPRIMPGERNRQLRHGVLIEECILEQGPLIQRVGRRGDSRNRLAEHGVDAGHVLPGHRPEEVSASPAGAHMCALVFEDMPDIFDAVLLAPVAQPAAVIFTPEAGDQVHIGEPQCGVAGGYRVPQCGQPEHQLVFGHPAPGREEPGHVGVPRIKPPELAHPVFGIIVSILAVAVAERRFVGEKSGEDRAEISGKTVMDFFVHLVDQVSAGACRDHCDIVGEHPLPGGIGGHHEIDAPDAGRQIEHAEAVFDVAAQVDRGAYALAAPLVAAISRYCEDGFGGGMFRQENGSGGDRPDDIHQFDPQALLAERRIFRAFQGVVRAAGVHMRVVEQPDAHPTGGGILQDLLEKPHPRFCAEPVAAAIFEDELRNTRAADRIHLLPDLLRILPRIPEQRDQIAAGPV